MAITQQALKDKEQYLTKHPEINLDNVHIRLDNSNLTNGQGDFF